MPLDPQAKALIDLIDVGKPALDDAVDALRVAFGRT